MNSICLLCRDNPLPSVLLCAVNARNVGAHFNFFLALMLKIPFFGGIICFSLNLFTAIVISKFVLFGSSCLCLFSRYNCSCAFQSFPFVCCSDRYQSFLLFLKEHSLLKILMLSYAFFIWLSFIFCSIYFTHHHLLSHLQTLLLPQTLAQHLSKTNFQLPYFRLFPLIFLS